MRAYLPISHSELETFLKEGSLIASEVFAPTQSYINENLDCDEEEIEYLLSVSAGERALELCTSPDAPGIVLAIDLEDEQCGQGHENLVSLNSAISWTQVQCALLAYESEDELVWFATQEIAPELVNWV